jgi:hypothetical protein
MACYAAHSARQAAELVSRGVLAVRDATVKSLTHAGADEGVRRRSNEAEVELLPRDLAST